MIDLGTVRPGSTIRIPFSSFDKDDGSSITMTNYAAADILVYKDGGTTERGTGGGITALTDFDSKTGKHLAIIDLADDATTADFFKAGSEYLVAIDAVTVDGVTTGGWIARFRIGYPNAYFDTSIATLASQTSFTLTVGPAEDDALNGMVLLVHDKASAIQVTRVVVEDYTGSTKTVTLRAAPATTFTIAAGDNVSGIGFDKVDLTHAGGAAITSSGGRPEVNATHFAGTAYATAAAALDDAVIAAIAALNNLSAAQVNAEADTAISDAALATAANLATVLSRLSAARAGYLDFLNIGGNVASSAEATAIQNNTRVVRVVPVVIERPDSGTTTYRIELFLYDDAGNMEAPDSAPTIALVNQAGTDRSSRLDSATMALVETGRYRAIYTADVADTLEQLVWAFSVVEGGATRKYGNQSVIVDTTAVDFTAADRTKLDTLHDTRLTAARAALLDQLDPATAGTAAAEVDVLIARLTALRAAALDLLDAAITSRLATAGYTAPPSAATIKAAVLDAATADHPTAGSVGKAISDGAAGSATPAQVADAVCDELLAGHVIPGSVAVAISAAGGAADPLLNPVPGAYASGTAGAALGRIGSSQITITSPVTQDGTKVTLISGDDYLNANGRALVFTRAAGSTEWPDLTGATVRLKTPAFAAVTGTVVVPTGEGQQMRFDVVRTLTENLADIFAFEVEAALATSANVVTLLRGTLVLVQDV